MKNTMKWNEKNQPSCKLCENCTWENWQSPQHELYWGHATIIKKPKMNKFNSKKWPKIKTFSMKYLVEWFDKCSLDSMN